ncbi:glutathione S-transferase family protein [Sphingobium nicotianae]|uniref:Glutathione S-transferase family protein n=1 Tax=Sphingobium nicotianae TaxID=2782607 RepID=A0A9X1D9N1_9SPHN|nr:glutathione S-transferase family protein [Sphingobium nicotianae]MBT2185825.1 glutathione S-transferase family protein [Sphingobium nicotianae]
MSSCNVLSWFNIVWSFGVARVCNAPDEESVTGGMMIPEERCGEPDAVDYWQAFVLSPDGKTGCREGRIMLTLYLAPGSSSMAPHIALHAIGAPFDIRPLSFARQEQREAAYLAINPEGKVPTLVDGDLVLTEVAGILFYLAKRFPEAGLLPDDVEAQARAVSWMSFAAATIHPGFMGGAEKAEAALRQAEQRLNGRAFAMGERMSIADIHLFRLFWRIRNTINLPLDALPGLVAHHDRMMALPCVRATIAVESEIGYELRGLKVPTASA